MGRREVAASNPSVPKRDRSVSSQRSQAKPFKIPKIMPQTQFSNNPQPPSLLTMNANVINLPKRAQPAAMTPTTDQNSLTTPITASPSPIHDAATRATVVAVLQAAKTIVEATSLGEPPVAVSRAAAGAPTDVDPDIVTVKSSQKQVTTKQKSVRNARLASKTKRKLTERPEGLPNNFQQRTITTCRGELPAWVSYDEEGVCCLKRQDDSSSSQNCPGGSTLIISDQAVSPLAALEHSETEGGDSHHFDYIVVPYLTPRDAASIFNQIQNKCPYSNILGHPEQHVTHLHHFTERFSYVLFIFTTYYEMTQSKGLEGEFISELSLSAMRIQKDTPFFSNTKIHS